MNVRCAPTVETLASELKAQRELMVHIREGDQRALQIQAAETARRLEDLNHSHDLSRIRDAHFVSREVMDAALKAVDVRIEAVTRLVYIGVGMALTVQVAVAILILFTKK